MDNTNYVFNIKPWRLKQGLTQKKLGELLGVQRITVLQWETGRRVPTLMFAVRISKLLDCTLDDLIKEQSG